MAHQHTTVCQSVVAHLQATAHLTFHLQQRLCGHLRIVGRTAVARSKPGVHILQVRQVYVDISLQRTQSLHALVPTRIVNNGGRVAAPAHLLHNGGDIVNVMRRRHEANKVGGER